MRLRYLVLLAFFATGCYAKKAFKTGFRAEESGRLWEAAGYYLKALDRKPEHEDATLGIDRIAETAFDEALTFAQAEEDGEDFLAAMSWYQEAKTYIGRLERHNQLDFSVGIDLEDKIEEMRAAAAFEAYADGDEFVAQRAWARAIERFKASQQIVPDFKDTSLRIAESHYGWAVDDVAAARFRSGAERFQRAVSNEGPFEDSAVRAVEIYAALGRHHLTSGACRQAVRDLRIANAAYPAEVGGDLSTAEDCAHKGVVLEPIRGGGRVSGIVVSEWLAGYIQREFASSSTEFVDLVADSQNKGDVDYRTSIRITEAWLHEPDVQVVERSATGRKARVCAETESSPCYQDVGVTYLEHTSVLSARVAASVQVVDTDTSRFVAQSQPVGTSDSRLNWADRFAAEGSTTAVGTEPSAGVVAVDSNLVALSGANRSHPPAADVTRQALNNVGSQTLSTILGAVDVEPPVRDPSSLTIVPLVEK